MRPDDPIRIELELCPAGDSVSGSLRTAGAPRRTFHGWLGLMTALVQAGAVGSTSLVGQPEPPDDATRI